MEARSYTLSELESHLQRSFDDTSPLVPVTPLRLASYMNNPRAEPSDHVLFEMREGDLLVAYRTLLPDHMYGRQGAIHRFAWLSGNYVNPAYRRRGISTRLLRLAEERWESRLMYTNYAPASKSVYDSTGQFRILANREGQRFYLRAASASLLKGRAGFQALLPMADRMVNSLVDGKLKKFTLNIPEGLRVFRTESIDVSMEEMRADSDQGSLFRRDRKVYQWILRYPWVTDDAVEPLPYHFSYRAGQFENLLFKFETEQNAGRGKTDAGRGAEGNGWLWLVVHGNRLSAPYLIASGRGILPAMARVVIDTMIRHRCAYLTVRHPGLREALMANRKWFLAVRRMPQLIFYHQRMEAILPDDFSLQDGDGDVVFTG